MVDVELKYSNKESFFDQQNPWQQLRYFFRFLWLNKWKSTNDVEEQQQQRGTHKSG